MAKVKRLKPLPYKYCEKCHRFIEEPYWEDTDHCPECRYEARSYVPPEDETYKWAETRTQDGVIGRTKIGIEGTDR